MAHNICDICFFSSVGIRLSLRWMQFNGDSISIPEGHSIEGKTSSDLDLTPYLDIVDEALGLFEFVIPPDAIQPTNERYTVFIKSADCESVLIGWSKFKVS